jgi:KDO2-lipid IV(A) lauroyltransferase
MSEVNRVERPSENTDTLAPFHDRSSQQMPYAEACMRKDDIIRYPRNATHLKFVGQTHTSHSILARRFTATILATVITSQPRPVSIAKRFRFRIETLALQTLAAVVPLLPHRFIVALSRAVGGCVYYFLGKPRQIALANLAAAYGDTRSEVDKQRIARASFQNFALTMFRLFWSPRLMRGGLKEAVEVDPSSLELIRRLQGPGKGIIFLVMHYGDWELMGLATALLGFPSTIVTERMRNAGLEAIFTRLRAQTGHRIISQRFAVTKLLKALKRGENIALLIDFNALRDSGGVWVNFFGLPVYNTAAPAGLALHTGAPLVFAVSHPLPDGRMRLTYEHVTTDAVTVDREAQLQAISQKCASHCEAVIREQPDPWLWSYKRWRYRLQEAPGAYPFYSHPLHRGRYTPETGKSS